MHSLKFLIALTVPLALLFGAERAKAQVGGDCGNNCQTCAANAWEGYGYDENGPYHMDCTSTGAGGGCVECEQMTASDDDSIPVASIAQALEVAQPSELAIVVAAYGDRLLFSSERGAVGIKDLDCSGEALAAMVFLPPEKASVLADLDVIPLRAFLSEPQASAASK